MLKVMRKHAKYFYVLFFIVILTFVFWGVGTVDYNNEQEIIAEVGKFKITSEDYWRTYDSAYRFYREIYKDKLDEEFEKTMNLKENVLDSMINEQVLLIASKKAGISVSDEELSEAIMNEPAFMKDGTFNKDVYLNRLRLMRITPEAYENSKRQELIITKMRRLIELTADVTDIESRILKTSEDEQVVRMLTQAMAAEKKEKVVKSYLEGLKKQIEIKINKDLIS